MKIAEQASCALPCHALRNKEALSNPYFAMSAWQNKDNMQS